MNYAWTVPLKKKNARTIKDSFENIPNSSKTQANLKNTEDQKDFENNFSTQLSNKNKIRTYSRHSSKGAVFTETIDQVFENLPQKPIFERSNE